MAEHNSLDDVGLREFMQLPSAGTLHWTDPDLSEIVRIRYLGERGCPFMDLSYAVGRNRSGEPVHVQGPPELVWRFVRGTHRRASSIKSQLIEAARKDGVYLKELCAGDIEGVLSWLF